MVAGDRSPHIRRRSAAQHDLKVPGFIGGVREQMAFDKTSQTQMVIQSVNGADALLIAGALAQPCKQALCDVRHVYAGRSAFRRHGRGDERPRVPAREAQGQLRHVVVPRIEVAKAGLCNPGRMKTLAGLGVHKLLPDQSVQSRANRCDACGVEFGELGGVDAVAWPEAPLEQLLFNRTVDALAGRMNLTHDKLSSPSCWANACGAGAPTVLERRRAEAPEPPFGETGAAAVRPSVA